jgi:hypothetical protein
MADMGYRDNVMGPQPIASRKPIPQSLLDTIARILDLLADGKGSEVIAMSVDTAKDETAKLAAAVKAGTYNDKSVIATARTNEHYWIKAKLTGPMPSLSHCSFASVLTAANGSFGKQRISLIHVRPGPDEQLNHGRVHSNFE